jgi:sugar O-acyltransferase (sialic acid O-acetyltransferase NeuD family)
MADQPEIAGAPAGDPADADIVVAGGGGHARVVISILRKLRNVRILGYTDLEDRGPLLGIPYLGGDEQLIRLAAAAEAASGTLSAAIGVGQVGLGSARHKLWMRLQPHRLWLPAIVSPAAIVNEEVSLGEGTAVMDGAVINCGATVGRGGIVNTHSTVEHDVRIGEWVHLAPGATICGDVTIGDFAMIGAGATVIEGRKIAACCRVGGGSTVIHDLTEPGVYVGSPARRIQ